MKAVCAWRDGHLATPLAIMLFSSPQHQGGPFFLSGLAIFPFRVCGACQVRSAQPGRWWARLRRVAKERFAQGGQFSWTL